MNFFARKIGYVMNGLYCIYFFTIFLKLEVHICILHGLENINFQYMEVVPNVRCDIIFGETSFKFSHL